MKRFGGGGNGDGGDVSFVLFGSIKVLVVVEAVPVGGCGGSCREVRRLCGMGNQRRLAAGPIVPAAAAPASNCGRRSSVKAVDLELEKHDVVLGRSRDFGRGTNGLHVAQTVAAVAYKLGRRAPAAGDHLAVLVVSRAEV